MPVVPSITNSARNYMTPAWGKVAAWGVENPVVYASAIAAAVVTPLFMKNDERGYLQTSAMTAPAIIAAAMVAPRLFPTINREGRRLIDIVKQIPTDYGFKNGVVNAATGDVDMAAAARAVAEGRLSPSDYAELRRKFHASAFKPSAAPDLEREFESVWNKFGEMYKNPANWRGLDNALARATLTDQGAAEKAGVSFMEAMAPSLTMDESIDAFIAHQGSLPWIRNVAFDLHELEQSKIAGISEIVPTIEDLHTTNTMQAAFHPYAKGGRDLLRQQYPEYTAKVDELIANNRNIDFSKLTVDVLPPGPNEPLGKIVGMRLNKEVQWSFPGANGGIRVGAHYENQGVSRYVIGLNDRLSAPEFALRAIPFGNGFAHDELAKLQFYAGHDTVNPSFMSSGEGMLNATAGQQWAFSQEGILSNLPGHLTEEGWDATKKKDPSRAMAVYKDQIERNGYGKSIGGNSIDSLISPEGDRLSPFGVPNAVKEGLTMKAMRQPGTTLVQEGFADPKKPFSSLYKGLFSTDEGQRLPTVALHTLQITPSQQALFGSLPELSAIQGDIDSGMAEIMKSEEAARDIARTAHWKIAAQRISMDLALSKNGYKARAIGLIAADAGISADEAEVAYGKMLHLLSNPVHYSNARNIGRVGDGSRLLMKGVGAKYMLEQDIVVDENALSEDMVLGKTFGADQIVGYEGRVKRFAKGTSNQVTGWSTDPITKQTRFHIQGVYDEQGVKGSRAVKWTNAKTLDVSERDSIVRLFNTLNEATGQKGRVPRDINSVTMQALNSDKANSPFEVLADQVSDVFRTFEDVNGSGNLPAYLYEKKFAGKSYMDRLFDAGITYQDHSLVGATTGARQGTAAKIELMEISNMMESLMNEAGERVASGQLAGDQFLENYGPWKAAHPQGTFTHFKYQFNLAESTAFQDSMTNNVAKRTKLSREGLRQLAMSGEHDIVHELQGRGVFNDGMPGMTWDYLAGTSPYKKGAYGDFAGTNALSFEESGIGNGGALSRLDGRVRHVVGPDGQVTTVPTVFDPKHPMAHENFRIDADVQGQTVNIPVLGHDAYGGAVNEHGLDAYSANAQEKELQHVGDVINKARNNEATVADALAARDAYIQKIHAEHGLGKDGIMRADLYDPKGVSGKLSLRPSTLTYKDGSHNPFEAGISDMMLDSLPSREAENLRNGGHMLAYLGTYPANTITPMKVVYDRRLNGSRQIAIDPIIGRTALRDYDGDPAALFPIYEHQARVSALIDDAKSLAAQTVDFSRALDGDAADTRRFVKHPFSEGIRGIIEKFRSPDLADSLLKRTASADIGMLANTFGNIEALMEHSTLFPDAAKKMQLHQVLFRIIEQAPIAAAKHGSKYRDMVELSGYNTKINAALADRTAGGADRFLTVMTEGAQNFGEEIDINSAHGRFFGAPPGMTGKINPLGVFIEMNPDSVKAVHASYDKALLDSIHLTRMNGEQAAKYVAEGHDILSALEGHMPIETAAARAGSTMADVSAATVGVLNEETSKAAAYAKKAVAAGKGVTNQAFDSAEKVVRATRGTGAGKVLAIGAAVATGAGLLFGSIHSPREGQALAPESGNQFRPEEEIGVDGHVPGEPDPGSMSANPARRVRPAQSGVRTAVVAPMGRNTELEVHMKAESRDRAAEASRLATRAAAAEGNSNLNITYRDTTRLDSLRTRDKIRDAMDERS